MIQPCNKSIWRIAVFPLVAFAMALFIPVSALLNGTGWIPDWALIVLVIMFGIGFMPTLWLFVCWMV
jgi:hypothetical protein